MTKSAFLALLMMLISSNLPAQDIYDEVGRREISSMLDSMIIFEALKPVVRELRIKTTLQDQQIFHLKKEVEMQGLANQQQQRKHEEELIVEGRKQMWKGIRIGSVCTVFVGTIAVAVTKSIIGK